MNKTCLRFKVTMISKIDETPTSGMYNFIANFLLKSAHPVPLLRYILSQSSEQLTRLFSPQLKMTFFFILLLYLKIKNL